MPAAERTRKTILVVDDEESVRNPASRMLVKAGFDVRTAEDAEHALEVLQQMGTPDLCLVDESLPGVSGSAFCAMLFDRDLDVRCVLMSGLERADISLPEELLDKVHFLAKPWTLDELTGTVHAALASDPR